MTGDPILVEHTSEFDTLVMVGPDRILRWDRAELPPAVTRPALDPLTPVGQFTALPGGTTIGSGSDAQRVRLLGVVLCAAMLLGVSDAALAVRTTTRSNGSSSASRSGRSRRSSTSWPTCSSGPG